MTQRSRSRSRGHGDSDSAESDSNSGSGGRNESGSESGGRSRNGSRSSSRGRHSQQPRAKVKAARRRRRRRGDPSGSSKASLSDACIADVSHVHRRHAVKQWVESGAHTSEAARLQARLRAAKLELETVERPVQPNTGQQPFSVSVSRCSARS